MKLVDILAKGLKSWPEGLECLSQLKGTGYIINGKGFDGRAFDALQIADETLVAGAIVTRVEWQAAVDALNAPKVVEWDGVGLPPVGVSCEMSLFASNKWELCIPVYYLNHPTDHSDQVVVYQNSLDGDVCYILDPPCSGSIEFRPFRTAEQVAAEERDAKAKDLYLTINWNDVGSTWDSLAASRKADYLKAIDAGYRKEPKPCGS